MLQRPNLCVYMGCVGQDKYHQLLHDAATKAGLILSYQVKTDSEERLQTGTCAVLITSNNRLVEEAIKLINNWFASCIDH
jgi:adenosine kinase